MKKRVDSDMKECIFFHYRLDLKFDELECHRDRWSSRRRVFRSRWCSAW